jgi:putative ATP-binding cassette transporter
MLAFLAGMVDGMQPVAAREYYWSGGRLRMSQGSEPEGDHRNLLLRFLSSAAGIWKGKSGRLSWPLSVGLVAIAFTQLTIQYSLNYWNRDFFNALERRDGALLWSQALIFIPLACSYIALAVVSVWGRMTMQRKWRQ